MPLTPFTSSSPIRAWLSADPLGQRFLPSYLSGSWEPLIDFKTRHLWIAEEGGEAVGFFDLELDPSGAGYFVFYVAPAHRGKGLAKKIAEAGLATDAAKSCRFFEAGVEPENAASIHVLESLGFERAGEDEDGMLLLRRPNQDSQRAKIAPSARRRNFFWKLALWAFAALALFVLAPRPAPSTTEAERETAAREAAALGLPIPPEPFVTDGCTLFPDSLPWHDYRAACVAHDVRYWLGGSAAARAEADEALGQAVARSGPAGRALGGLMKLGVRLFGDTWVSRIHGAAWGYGYVKNSWHW